MSKITREQFLRGMEAINRYRTMRDEIEGALQAGGCGSSGSTMAGDNLLEELELQLSDRCNDPPNVPVGSMISYVLYEDGGKVWEADGTEYDVDTSEALWVYWETTSTGPFEDLTPDNTLSSDRRAA